MRTTTKLSVAVAAVAGLCFSAVGMVSPVEARATPASDAQANPTITITNQAASYVYSAAQLDTKAGQAITLTNCQHHPDSHNAASITVS
jgi:plastocyanin